MGVWEDRWAPQGRGCALLCSLRGDELEGLAAAMLPPAPSLQHGETPVTQSMFLLIRDS